MPEWGAWLIGRWREKWPAISDPSFLGKIHAWSASNHLAVGLAVTMRDNMDGRPYVRASFAFARYGAVQSSPGEKAIVALYRHMREWTTSMRAAQVYFSGRSDIGLSRRQTLLGAEKETEIFQRQQSSSADLRPTAAD
jgi:hypothetical protein